jgi:7,8-dihydropterin-6-yl-methyl-4-(beta-D-ribofuranosyl)aminobenzene 5'-phosphate synthase
MRSWLFLALVTVGLLLSAGRTGAQTPGRVTILVDAFGQSPRLQQDWGFAALIEYQGKRILFDTGNNAGKFTANAKALGIDLTRLDFVVISHRHGDHTDGLHHLLKVNPRVKIYAPYDEYFGGPTPTAFFRRPDASLPVHMRYFTGKVPAQIPHGTPWRGANIQLIDSVAEVLPGFTVVRNIAPQGQPFHETPELSLAIQTPQGQVLLVGCSHPGIENILASVSARKKPVQLLIGGLHLVQTPPAELNRLAGALRDDWRVARIAPGHCTGEAAFATLQQQFGARYTYAGVGTVLSLP